MSILARFKKSFDVEVLSTFATGDGRKLATVKALAGSPFKAWSHGGWSESATANVPADLLSDVRRDPVPEPARPNLLGLALAAFKPQWYASETIPLWKSDNGQVTAWLREGNQFIWLGVKGYDKGLPVFFLGLGGWQVVGDVDRKYADWARQAQKAVVK
jgi:hypothetical protein